MKISEHRQIQSNADFNQMPQDAGLIFSFCNEELILCKSASIPVEREMHEDNANLTQKEFL